MMPPPPPRTRHPPTYNVAAQMARLQRLGRAHSHEGVTSYYHDEDGMLYIVLKLFLIKFRGKWKNQIQENLLNLLLIAGLQNNIEVCWLELFLRVKTFIKIQTKVGLQALACLFARFFCLVFV